MEANQMDSTQAAEYLGIGKNNLRQLVFRKLLAPTGKEKRKSVFNIEDLERIKITRTPSVPSA
jgi:hypothetical protein